MTRSNPITRPERLKQTTKNLSARRSELEHKYRMLLGSTNSHICLAQSCCVYCSRTLRYAVHCVATAVFMWYSSRDTPLVMFDGSWSCSDYSCSTLWETSIFYFYVPFCCHKFHNGHTLQRFNERIKTASNTTLAWSDEILTPGVGSMLFA